jgi:hypothetical protein
MNSSFFAARAPLDIRNQIDLVMKISQRDQEQSRYLDIFKSFNFFYAAQMYTYGFSLSLTGTLLGVHLFKDIVVGYMHTQPLIFFFFFFFKLLLASIIELEV